jgi:hypothetical protein
MSRRIASRRIASRRIPPPWSDDMEQALIALRQTVPVRRRPGRGLLVGALAFLLTLLTFAVFCLVPAN